MISKMWTTFKCYNMVGKYGFRKIGIIFENNDVKVEYDNSNFI